MLEAAPPGFEDAHRFEPERLGAIRSDHAADDGRHIVLADPDGAHRLWVRGNPDGQPVAAIVPLGGNIDTRIATVERFNRTLIGQRAGPLPAGWPLTPYRRTRVQQIIHALDLEAAGAGYRGVAAIRGNDEVLGLRAAALKASPERAWAYRILRDAHAMAAAGYQDLLDFC
jgi:hypothetical protein